MAQDEKQWHPQFLKYMEEIVNHPNYKGLPIKKKARWFIHLDSNCKIRNRSKKNSLVHSKSPGIRPHKNRGNLSRNVC